MREGDLGQRADTNRQQSPPLPINPELRPHLHFFHQSYEYQRVLDGELAQRADTNRQLKEVEKRLMLAENLVPASPLVIACGGGSGAVAMAAAMAAPSEGKERLLQHREVLVAQVWRGGEVLVAQVRGGGEVLVAQVRGEEK